MTKFIFILMLFTLISCGTQTLVKNCKDVDGSHYAACEKLGFWE